MSEPAHTPVLLAEVLEALSPEPGKLIAFPPLWMFPHAGLPPRSTPKYILHTYLCYPA